MSDFARQTAVISARPSSIARVVLESKGSLNGRTMTSDLMDMEPEDEGDGPEGVGGEGGHGAWTSGS